MYLSSLLCVAATGIGNVVDLFAARRDDDGVDRSAYGIIFDLLIYQVGSARVSVLASAGVKILGRILWLCFSADPSIT